MLDLFFINNRIFILLFFIFLIFIFFYRKKRILGVLDRSALEDYRTIEILNMPIFQGVVLIPDFFLLKPDLSKFIEKIKNKNIKIKLVKKGYKEKKDSENLFYLAKKYNTIIITSSSYLSLNSRAKKINVFDIQQFSERIDIRLVPGQHILVFPIKGGKNPNQAVAYLNDGSMVVIDDARQYLNKHIFVSVRNVIKNYDRRIIFTEFLGVKDR